MNLKINNLLIKIYQFIEYVKEKGIVNAIKFSIYTKGLAVPVVKDLNTLNIQHDNIFAENIKFIEVTGVNSIKNNLIYELKSRDLKLKNNLKKGFNLFAIVDNHEVVADVWYVTKSSTKLANTHQDLVLLGIELTNSDVYLFDAYVVPGKRGKAIATKFMGSVLQELKKKGFERAYGYYMSDNIPALWFHRIIGYKEFPSVLVERYFFYQFSSRQSGNN